jgi:hypothetical protein
LHCIPRQVRLLPISFRIQGKYDGFVKSPHAAPALHPSSLRRTQKYAALLADLRALPANFLQSRLKIDFLRSRQYLNPESVARKLINIDFID